MPSVISGDANVSATEFGYLDGVTSAIQTQINTKADILSNGAWTAYTPTWSGLTVGNATQSSAYTQIGKLVVVRIQLTLGSTSSVSAASDFSLPVTARSITGNPNMGVARFFDANASQYIGTIVFINTTTARVQTQQVSGSQIIVDDLGATKPFTWASTDQIHALLMYEAA